MQIIKAQFRIVTPMFLGDGSDGTKDGISCADTIRGASVKGALRAIYRSLNWGRVREQSSTHAQALQLLHHQEADLFGASAKTDGNTTQGGQAKFLLRVKSERLNTAKELSPCSVEVKYLLGLGLFDFKKGMLRDHIVANSKFSIELGLKPVVTATQKQQLIDALLVFGLLGNLGSRARKGFGSVSIIDLNIDGEQIELPQTANDYKETLKRIISSKLATEPPPFTAFFSGTQLQVSAKERNAMQLLKIHGLELGMYRSYGHNHNGKRQALNRTPEQNFINDHDWAYAFSRNDIKQVLPKRAVFGLPHPYHLKSGSVSVSVKVEATINGKNTRRASPLFAHIHQLPSGECLLVHTLYRSDFLPKGEQVTITSNTNRDSINNVAAQIDWSVIEQFLQRFNTREVIHV